MNPTEEELEEGVHKSRRLARNAARLGIDTEQHRELIGWRSFPEKIVQSFDDETPSPSTGPRLKLDQTMDPLPFQDGPGVVVGLPKATREFWTGKDAEGKEVDPDKQQPEFMWEVMACPVVVRIRFRGYGCWVQRLCANCLRFLPFFL